MPTSYRSYMPDQGLLLPTSLLPEDHLAYFISDAVDTLELENFHACYAGDGRRRQPFCPRMMVMILVKLAREAALVSRVGVDGAKIKADASKHKAMNYARMQDEEARLKREIAGPAQIRRSAESGR
jgi:hypothetical protein